MEIKIVPNATGNPPGKVADAEIHFGADDGILSGCRLIGFSIWERRGRDGFNVTFPARQYSINGERRSFALLRPIEHVEAQNRIRDAIIDKYREVVDPKPVKGGGPAVVSVETWNEVCARAAAAVTTAEVEF